MLIEDMKRTDHLIYVDTTLSLTEQEHEAVKNQEPIDFDRVAQRKSQIAEQAYKFLMSLQTPLESTFSDTVYLHHLNLKQQVVTD